MPKNRTEHDHDSCELLLLLLVLQSLQLLVEEVLDNVESMLQRHIKEQRMLDRCLPLSKKRVRWDLFVDRIPAKHFRRMFRMTLTAFETLCVKICEAIGRDVFRPEIDMPDTDRTIPPICGEVKVAVAIRMLAGGSYLDIVGIFDVSSSHLYTVLDDFLKWVLQTFEFPLARYLRERDWDSLMALADHFAEKTDGIFYGPFAALDGLAARIRCPWLSEVPDPGNYYCRKGFYALNVQAMVDRKKRFLWCHPSNKGSTHDSQAFASSRMHDLLLEVSSELYERGLFVVGDSAYGMSSVLLTPFDTDEVKADREGAKDSFNFHLSSCRIYIECAFGELVMRWGIFWRTLLFDLKKNSKVVQCCMLLHNFIVDAREAEDREDDRFFQNFTVNMDSIQERLTVQTGEMPRPVATDNNEPSSGGRPALGEAEQRKKGMALRS